jgi:peptidoglycan hydrolase CwlO-like protein
MLDRERKGLKHSSKLKGDHQLKKSFIALNMAVAVGAGSLFSAGYASAESISELRKKESQIEENRSKVHSNIKDTEKSIDKVKGEQADLASQLQKLEKEMKETEDKINELNAKIIKTKEQIKELKKEIEVLEDKIEKRNELLKDRARSYQATGGNMNYLEVLLGASDFGEFVERLSAVSTIMDADQDLITEQERDKKELEDKKKSVEQKLGNLESMMAEVKEMKAKQEQQKKEKKQLMKKLKQEQKHLENEKIGMEEEADILAGQEAAIKKAIEQEQARQAEIARQKEAEQKRQAELAKQQAAKEKKQAVSSPAASKSSSSSNSSGSSSTSSSESAAPAPSSSGSGIFMKPSAGYYSSGYGGRWGTNHNGIDIAASGKVPIVAAADGVVSRSYFSSSYGNAIFITHYINGKQYTTVYAHMSSRMASNGQTVKKGQQIGLMGNTGRSFGQHLHFEIHEGPWNISKSNAVNPRKYF